MNATINYQIGWFGIPGKDGGKTHLTINGKPCCGMRLHSKSEFQWCSNGFNIYLVECDRCLKIQKRLSKEQADLKAAKAKKSEKIKFDMTIKTKQVEGYGFIPSSMYTYPKYASIYYRVDAKARQITIVSNYVPMSISRFTLTPEQFKRYIKGDLALVPPHCCCAHDIDFLEDPEILYSGDFNDARHLKQIFNDLNIQPKSL